MKAQQKYLLIRQYASTQSEDSHLAIRAVKHKATQIPEYYNISEGDTPDSRVPIYTPTPKRSSHPIRTPPESVSGIFETPRPTPIDIPDYGGDAAGHDVDDEIERRNREHLARQAEAKAKAKAMLGGLYPRMIEKITPNKKIRV